MGFVQCCCRLKCRFVQSILLKSKEIKCCSSDVQGSRIPKRVPKESRRSIKRKRRGRGGRKGSKIMVHCRCS
jgi:hypothetical protein